MKKVLLDNLPKRGKLVDWKNSIGYNVKFIYDDIEGELPILNYVKKGNRGFIVTEYENNKNFHIRTEQFSNGNLGKLLNKKSGNKNKKKYERKKPYKYKFSIGDIVNSKHLEKLKILEQIRIPCSKGTKSGYKYKCLICGNIDNILEVNLRKGGGCNICCNASRKVLKGVNDLWTTHPEIAKMLKYPEIGYEISYGISKKQTIVCEQCGYENNVIINNLINNLIKQGYSCPRCNDGKSYPEKFMISILEQSKIEFETEYSPSWCKYIFNGKNKKGRYDFYFKLNDKKYIIETDGYFHKNNNNMNGMTKGESQFIDNEKDRLAKEHGIEVIRINCEESDLEYIKNNILNSKLNKLFNLNNIDWNKCEEFAINNLVRLVCDSWNNYKTSALELSKILKMSRSVVRKYLFKGKKLGWCNYNSKIIMNNTYKNRKEQCKNNQIKVICLNNKKIFNSITEACNFYHISSAGNLSTCCKGNRNFCGKDPITKELLKWMYYDEYIELQK